MVYGLQHVMTVYAGLVAGLATLLQTLGLWRIGARLPLVQGTSFAAVASMAAIRTHQIVDSWRHPMTALFCSGDAMRGGRLHHNVSAHPFLGAVRTAPHYRMYSVRDAFPALLEDPSGGVPLAGEIYDVPLSAIRTDFLPDEPPELELTVIELDDGRDVLAVGLRPGVLERQAGELTDITDHGGWRAYRGLPEPERTSA